jgi:hypothetical protein
VALLLLLASAVASQVPIQIDGSLSHDDALENHRSSVAKEAFLDQLLEDMTVEDLSPSSTSS